MPKISTKCRLVGKDSLWHYNWVRQREIGHKFPLGFSNQFHKNLYSNIYPCDSWDHNDSLEGAHPGGVFNLEFSPDGSLLVAACEKKSFLIFDSLSRKQIHAVDNAHVDCVNCVRFLDSRIFVTCSDDKTVALWDARNLKSRIRTLYGHSNWVKNVEYSAADGLLVTSGFDGSIYSWDINSYAENGFTLKRLFHTNGLMRTRLTPDASKMVICTTSGYLMIIHDLDLHELSQDLQGFKPNMYRLMQQSQTTIPSASMYTHLFSRKRKRNRIEFVSDFPAHDDAEVVSSLQIHPQGWCALSRNISHEEVSEWTCVHDIQDCPDDGEETDLDTNYDTEDDSTTLGGTSAPTASEEAPALSNSDSEDNEVAGAARVGTRRNMLNRRDRVFRGFVRHSSSLGGPTEERSAALGGRWHPVGRPDRPLLRTRRAGRFEHFLRSRSPWNSRIPIATDPEPPSPPSEPEPNRLNALPDSPRFSVDSDNRFVLDVAGTSEENQSSTTGGSSSSSSSNRARAEPSASTSAAAAAASSATDAASTSSASPASSSRARASAGSASASSASSGASLPGPGPGPGLGPGPGPGPGPGAAQAQAQARQAPPPPMPANHSPYHQNIELQVASSDVWEALVAIRAARARREAGNPRVARVSEFVRRLTRNGDQPSRWVWYPSSRTRENSEAASTVSRPEAASGQAGENEGGSNSNSGRHAIFVLAPGYSDYNRRRIRLHSSEPQCPYFIPRNQKIHQNIQRLTHFIEEPNVGKGFIKELCFSSEGRIMCSPFGYGVRLLAFSPNCAELSTCVPEEPPVRLFELVTNICHADYVVSSKFSPRHCQLVSGCLKGKIVWHQPVL